MTSEGDSRDSSRYMFMKILTTLSTNRKFSCSFNNRKALFSNSQLILLDKRLFDFKTSRIFYESIIRRKINYDLIQY